MRCNADDIQNIFEFIASINSLDAMETGLAPRLSEESLAKLKEMTNTGCDLLTEVLKTIPPEKYHTIRKLQPAAKFRVYFAPKAAVDKDMIYVSDGDLTTLCKGAHEQCKLCFDQKCKSCEYGKVFDRIISIDRENGSWADYDI